MDKTIHLINKLYGNHHYVLDNVADVMGSKTDNQQELNRIEAHGYQPVKAAEEDSHRFSYDNLGYPEDAINNAKRDIQDIEHSKTAQTSRDFQAEIDFDKRQIDRDEKVPAHELVMISRLNNGKITHLSKPMDIEMIYHNTHSSMNEIINRHPNTLAYTAQDAKLDAKRDLE
ncbi:hypothetical protein [Acetilactobacillus jinshanensis]|uniref:Uncharacterized protein n=1 Tax=Acetilactobacillus jinshanensis TaxID=1720083 RepID=A0A4P6ZLD8_9LACO|nr:hypothetical protein [Acetilactobacillus jinshanensis]QBP18347.1 hypothetical protein ELX58_04175 [Acetilactobacillus jinshanensis]URL61213.1 hypothetical protein HGK75_04245 [uncultured bacterium]